MPHRYTHTHVHTNIHICIVGRLVISSSDFNGAALISAPQLAAT